MPCGLIDPPNDEPLAVGRRSPLLQDFQHEPFVDLHPGGGKKGSDGARRPTLTADDLAEILISDPQLKNGCLLAFDLSDLNVFGIVHQRFRDLFEKLFHRTHGELLSRREVTGGGCAPDQSLLLLCLEISD